MSGRSGRAGWLARAAFVATSFALLVASAIIGAAGGTAVEPLRHTVRPNLILILSDDQRADMVGQMPSVERLAQHGVTFSNAFVTTSYCCPSRASILSGEYSRHTGVLDNTPPHGGAPAFHDASTLATWLHDAGYTTAMIGKYLNRYGRYEPRYIPPGWDEWDAIASEPTASRYYDYDVNENGTLVHYGAAPGDYSTTVLTRLALRFVRTARAPFFLYFAPIAPHRPAVPAPGDVSSGEAAERVTAAPAFNERDVRDKPWRGRYPRFKRNAIGAIEQYAGAAEASLAALDRAVGELTDLVDLRGGTDDTIVVYTSDNGYLLGEHRLQGKIWPYEPSIRVPMIVRVPWQASPRVDGHLVLNIDLASTLADLAGARPGLPQDGRSFAPLLRGRGPPWRHAFVVEWLGDERSRGTPPRFEAIRTSRFLYVEYENGWRELYDLRVDPDELRNVAGSPAYAASRRELAARLRSLLAR